MRIRLLIAASLIVATLTAPVPASATSSTKLYIAATLGVPPFTDATNPIVCDGLLTLSPGIGGNCFRIDGPAFVTITVTDFLTTNPAGSAMVDVFGEHKFFCGSTTIGVPGGTHYLGIAVGGIDAIAPGGCLPGQATVGTITINY